MADERRSAEEHFARLERLYHEAPITRSQGTRISISKGRATVSLDVREDHLHAAGGLHGSLYFRVLDDAAFFAANSLVEDALVLTASFSLDFLRPVETGTITAHGQVIERTGNRFVCSAEARDEAGDRVAWGKGTFVQSGIPLGPEIGYR